MLDTTHRLSSDALRRLRIGTPELRSARDRGELTLQNSAQFDTLSAIGSDLMSRGSRNDRGRDHVSWPEVRGRHYCGGQMSDALIVHLRPGCRM